MLRYFVATSSHTVGDAGFVFTYERFDDNLEVVDITGQTVEVVFLAPSGVTKTRACTVDTEGLFASYTLDAADFDESGVWFYEFNETGPSVTCTSRPTAVYVGVRL